MQNMQGTTSSVSHSSRYMRAPVDDHNRDPKQFLSHRPMLQTERAQPAAVCTRCNAFSFTFSAIDQPCERTSHGRVCKGVLSCVLAANDEWQKCGACEATGWHSGMVCIHCQSLGWVFFRHHQRRN